MITSLNLINMVYENYWAAVKRIQIPFDKRGNWRKQAKILNLSRSVLLRLEWLIYYETSAKNNASLTCRHFDISAKTFYKWKNRFDGKNLKLLEDQDKAPKNKRKRTITAQEEMRIVAVRKKHIRWGKIKLAILYQREFKEKIMENPIHHTKIQTLLSPPEKRKTSSKTQKKPS